MVRVIILVRAIYADLREVIFMLRYKFKDL